LPFDVSFLSFYSPFCTLFCVADFFYCLSPLFLFSFFIALLFPPSFSPLFCLYFSALMGFISSLPQLVWD
jgi:hypothetical protein